MRKVRNSYEDAKKLALSLVERKSVGHHHHTVLHIGARNGHREIPEGGQPVHCLQCGEGRMAFGFRTGDLWNQRHPRRRSPRNDSHFAGPRRRGGRTNDGGQQFADVSFRSKWSHRDNVRRFKRKLNEPIGSKRRARQAVWIGWVFIRDNYFLAKVFANDSLAACRIPARESVLRGDSPLLCSG